MPSRPPSTPGAPRADDPALALTATAPGAGPPPDPDDGLAPGDTLGRYVIGEQLGAGGMGVVYAAHDPDLDRKVAIKLLRGRHDADAARKRLLREARAMASLNHPCVITVHGVETTRNRDFVVMEYVGGGTLAQWLAARPRPWRQVVRVFRQAGRGLAAAHHAGLIHRDFKPANVLIADDGRVLVTDFGLARRRGDPRDAGADARQDDGSLGALTATGAVVGTPAYMAPEQLSGAEADARSDQFSYCVALYEALYGERPFAGDTFATLRAAVLSGRVAEPPRRTPVPGAIRKALLRGLRADPEARFPSMAALLAAIGGAARPSARRVVALGSAAAAIVGAVVCAVAGPDAGRDRGAAARCAPGAAQLAGVWDEARREQVRAAFARAAGDGRGEQLARVTDELDRYRAGWLAAYDALCSEPAAGAGRSAGGGDDRAFHLRVGCLLEHRAQLASLVDVLAAADADMVDQAAPAIARLPPAEACADIASSEARLRDPDDPGRRGEVAELRAELRRIAALRDAARLVDARGRADDAVARAQAIGFAPLRAEALHQLGLVLIDLREAAAARAALHEAALLAEEAAHDEVLARALVALARVETEFSSDRERARAVSRRAAAAVSRYGRDHALRAELDELEATARLEDQEYEPGLALLEAALAGYERAGDPVSVARVLTGISDVRAVLGDAERALAAAERARDLMVEAYGPWHPRTVHVQQQVAAQLWFTGRLDEAHALAADTEAFWRTPRGRELLRAGGHGGDDGGPRRVIAGRVVGPDGAPVAGARVIAGEYLVGDGKHPLFHLQGQGPGFETWVREATTDAAGAFELSDVRTSEAVILADAPGVGRSAPVVLPASDGAGSPAGGGGAGGVAARGDRGDREVVLALRPFGALEGRIARSAPDAASGAPGVTGIQLVPKRDGRAVSAHALLAIAGPDGRYRFDRLPAGTYAAIGFGDATQRQMSLSAREVTIRAGETARLDVAAEPPGVVVRVVVRDERGVALGGAQVVLFAGRGAAATVRELDQLVLGRAGRVQIGSTQPVSSAGGGGAGEPVPGMERARPGDGVVAFEDVPAGAYTMCVVAFGRDIKDPQFTRSVLARRPDLGVRCEPLRVASAPAEQVVVIETTPTVP